MKSIADSPDKFTLVYGCYYVSTVGRVFEMEIECSQPVAAHAPGGVSLPYSYKNRLSRGWNWDWIRVEAGGRFALISGRNLEPLFFSIGEYECRGVMPSRTPQGPAATLQDEQMPFIESIAVGDIEQLSAE